MNEKLKKLLVVLMFLCVLTLSACKSNNSKANIISAVDLTEREDTIISTISNHSFVFDYTVDTAYKEVALWVDKYELGELTEEKLGHMTTQIDKDSGTMILATPRAGDEKNQQTYYIGVGEQDMTSSVIFTDGERSDTENFATVFGQLTGEKSISNGENVLATIAYSDNEFGTSSVSNDFYQDPKSHIDELNKYNIVYLFKAEFRK